MFAPWASNGVHGVITGDITGPLGFTTSGIQQAAADGNQFIFNDIGGRYAAFIEMYEANPHPTEAQLESFFSTNFDDGDGTIRNGFAAYVAAMEEDDPSRRQRLMFEANTLVATHEQAGVQPYLEDGLLRARQHRHPLRRAAGREHAPGGDRRRAPGTDPNNLIIPQDLLSFDTGDRTAASYVGDDHRFQIGGENVEGW